MICIVKSFMKFASKKTSYVCPGWVQTEPLVCLVLSSIWKWIRIRVFVPEYWPKFCLPRVAAEEKGVFDLFTWKAWTSNIMEWMSSSLVYLWDQLTVTTVWNTGETGDNYEWPLTFKIHWYMRSHMIMVASCLIPWSGARATRVAKLFNILTIDDPYL